MSFFSSSSKKHSYRQSHHGSGRYKKKGILNEIFSIFSSNSRSHRIQHQPFNQNFGGVGCPRCKAAVTPGAKFCNSCGENIGNIGNRGYCAGCGKNLTPGDRFCSNCGRQA